MSAAEARTGRAGRRLHATALGKNNNPPDAVNSSIIADDALCPPPGILADARGLTRASKSPSKIFPKRPAAALVCLGLIKRFSALYSKRRGDFPKFQRATAHRSCIDLGPFYKLLPLSQVGRRAEGIESTRRRRRWWVQFQSAGEFLTAKKKNFSLSLEMTN